MISTLPRPRRVLLTLAVTTAVVIGGCGSDSEDPATTSEAEADLSGPEPSGPAGADGGGGGSPGAAGLVAVIDGTTLQVQGMAGQVAVTYTDTTAITATVDGTAADVAAGVCVLVQSEGADPEATEVTATSVAVTQPAEDGSCGGGLGGGFAGGGGGGAGGGGGRPTELPDGAPTDRPSRSPGTGGDVAFAGPTVGVVTEVGADGFTVEVTRPSRGEETTAAPTAVTVTTSAGTTWTTQVAAGPEALVEGTCVVAAGEPDSTGAVTAASIAVSPAVDGACQGPGGGGPDA
ncbi:hypothetical protein [Jiangella alkaliphila]|uniref:DUF5666 domain-containing protein n=1 Tax=Jiangella alkaliphila TaxID=419479 RepID=A0A1H2J3Z9_9ACTN|nr:hypothetical protein [Jiangella alkaliphila]SDU51183.1 hypothetical protein SAMN04488563_2282 [Jiangella alkaliphila]